MNDNKLEKPEESSKSWLEKISQVLTGEPRNRGELVEILREASERDLLDSHSLGMIEGILEVPELRTRDIMIPRPQMITLSSNQSLEDILPIVLQSGHSRFPVMGENVDEIQGLLLAKDLLGYAFSQEKRDFNLKDVLRSAHFIPESKRLDSLLQEFRENRSHMAIVVDEYGGVTGLVTIEDVIEQIIGDIEDEYDPEEQVSIKQRPDGSYTVSALSSLEDFNEMFETEIYAKDVETVGGFITRKFGHLPQRGETIELDDFTFKVLRADSRRIKLLQVVRTSENG